MIVLCPGHKIHTFLKAKIAKIWVLNKYLEIFSLIFAKNDLKNAGYVVAPDLRSGYAVVALVLTPGPKIHTFFGLECQI